MRVSARTSKVVVAEEPQSEDVSKVLFLQVAAAAAVAATARPLWRVELR